MKIKKERYISIDNLIILLGELMNRKKIKAIPFFVSIVLFVLAVYSFLFAILPSKILIRLLPGFSDFIINIGTSRIMLFIIVSYFLFAVGLFFYIFSMKLNKKK
jgi:hypothetical protein